MFYQLEYTRLPLTGKSTDTVDLGHRGQRSALHVRHERRPPAPPLGPQLPVGVFRPRSLRRSRSSGSRSLRRFTPLFTLTLPGSGDDDGLTFDHKGNVWVEDAYNKKVYEFPAPFTDNTTLVPSLTLSLPDIRPSGLAFDSKGDLFVSNARGHGEPLDRDVPRADHGCERARRSSRDSSLPVVSRLTSAATCTRRRNTPYGAGAAIVRYDAGHLKPGATPSVVDTAGLKGAPYEANFAWDASGNLYVADCGSAANVRVYPLATKPFSSKLSPSVTHRDASFSRASSAHGGSRSAEQRARATGYFLS